MSATHAQVKELLPLYVLGALEGTEDCDAVCSHLASGCPECTAELAEHAGVAAAVAGSLQPIEPRPDVRAALEKKLDGRVKSKIVSIDAAREKKKARTQVPWPWVVVPAAAAAAALVIAINLNEQLRWERNRHFEDAKEIANLSADKDRLAKEIAKNDTLTDALARGEAQVIALGPAADGQTGSGHVIWNKRERTWTLLAAGLKPLTPDQVYELWFIKNGTDPRSAVRFSPGANGVVRQTIKVPDDMPAIDLAAVTLEPRKNDDPKPSGTLVIAGKITG